MLKPRTHSFILLFFLSFIFITPVLAESFSGKVVGVSDGDTIKVIRAGKVEKVRLERIDCPEKRQAFVDKAKAFTSGLVFDRVVSVKVKGTDRFGRLLAEVFLEDGRSLNRKLVKAGLAWLYRR